jgi:E3 ubiquitin-protein ligase RNF14
MDNSNESILFLWYTSLSAQGLEWLNITTTLDLTRSFPSTITKSLKAQLTSAQVATTIHNYEREKKLILLSRTLITCPICMSDVYGSDCFSCYACSAAACKSCIKSYLDTRINEGQVKSITCPIDPSCHMELTPTQIASVVEKQTFRRYDRLLFQLSIDSMDDIIYCPRCQKPVIVTQGTDNHLSNTLGECATCSFVFCTLCGKTFHGVNPCQYSESMFHSFPKTINHSFLI